MLAAELEESTRQRTETQAKSSGARVEDYILGKELGRGSFAKVYLAVKDGSGDKKAIKKIDRSRLSMKLLQNLDSEISILKNFRHENIVKLDGIMKNRTHIFLVLEYCSGGDLHKFIKSKGRLSEPVAKHFMRHLAAGLSFLYHQQLIHRDIKPQNLLLSHRAEDAVLKIADFGFARHLATEALADTLCGSPLYMAPEILQFQKYDSKADLWSAGTVLFEMLTGEPPYKGATQAELVHNIRTRGIRLPPGVRPGKSCVNLLQMLLERKPAKRASFEVFLSAEFLQEPTPAMSSNNVSPISPETQSARSFEPQQPLNLFARSHHSQRQSATPQDPVYSNDMVPTGRKRSPSEPFSDVARPQDYWAITPPRSMPARPSQALTQTHRHHVSPSVRAGIPANLPGNYQYADGFTPPRHPPAPSGYLSSALAPAFEPLMPSPPAHVGVLPKPKTPFSPGVESDGSDEWCVVEGVEDSSIHESGHLPEASELSEALVGLQSVESLGRCAIAVGLVGDTLITSTLPKHFELQESVTLLPDSDSVSSNAETKLGETDDTMEQFGTPQGEQDVARTEENQRLFMDALSLYLKAMALIKQAILISRSLLSKPVGLHPSQRTIDNLHEARQRIAVLSKWLADQFQLLLQRAEQCQQVMAAFTSEHGPIAHTTCLEERIYRAALQIAHGAAVKEMLGHFEVASKLYRQGQALLHTLLLEGIPEADRMTLESLCTKFQHRNRRTEQVWERLEPETQPTTCTKPHASCDFDELKQQPLITPASIVYHPVD